MTSNDTSRVNGLYLSTSDKDYKEKMRDFRRPTLCVIDENSCEIPIDFTSDVPRTLHYTESEKDSLENLALRDHNDNVTDKSNELLVPDRDLIELKAATARLNLSTRRKSTVAWQQEHLSSVKTIQKPDLSNRTLDSVSDKDDGFTEERKNRINEALAWLRSELVSVLFNNGKRERRLIFLET